MIDEIIKKRNMKHKDCAYHTRRILENGKIRALVIKGENIMHIEYTCPECGYSGYKTQEWKKASKGAKIKFIVECDKCKFKIKVRKLKGKK